MLLLLLSLVSTALSGSPCCWDRQYEAQFDFIGGALSAQNGLPSHSLYHGKNEVHRDYYQKKMLIENTMFFPNGTNSSVNILFDHNTDLTYYILDGGKGACYSTPTDALNSYNEECIPDNAQKLQESYLGYGANQIAFTTWQFFEPKSATILRISVTEENCIPLVETLFGTINRARTDVLMVMTGFRPGLRKASLLNTPKNCQPVPQSDLPERAQIAAEQTKRFI